MTDATLSPNQQQQQRLQREHERWLDRLRRVNAEARRVANEAKAREMGKRGAVLWKSEEAR
jgi:hypothetical protein